jgi:hypothetical protein
MSRSHEPCQDFQQILLKSGLFEIGYRQKSSQCHDNEGKIALLLSGGVAIWIYLILPAESDQIFGYPATEMPFSPSYRNHPFPSHRARIIKNFPFRFRFGL